MSEQDGRPSSPWAAPDPAARPASPDLPASSGAPSAPPAQPLAVQPPPAQPPARPQPAGSTPWAGPDPYGPPPEAVGPAPWGSTTALPPWAQGPYAQPWLPAEPDPAEKRRRRRRAVAALAGVVLLLIGGLGAVSWYDDRREQRVREEVAALVPELRDFVAEERGLPFLRDVRVEVLDDDAFLEALYAEDEEAEEREDRDPEPTLKALGLLDADADLEEELTESLDAGVVGFYDPRSERLVVRGRDSGPFTQLVMVHELTHALQDQHFELHRPEYDEADDERSLAFTALVEGDATRVEQAWFEAQPPERQREIGDAVGGAGRQDSPDVVDTLLGFPYVAGPGYVEGLLEQGGQRTLDAAFREPPTTTEQVLRPAEPLAVVDVPAPEPEGDVVDAGVIGVLGFFLFDGVDPLGDATLPGGWAGDAYVTWTEGDRTCTVVHVAADERAPLEQYLRAIADTREDARVDDGPAGTVRLRSCVS